MAERPPVATLTWRGAATAPVNAQCPGLRLTLPATGDGHNQTIRFSNELLDCATHDPPLL